MTDPVRKASIEAEGKRAMIEKMAAALAPSTFEEHLEQALYERGRLPMSKAAQLAAHLHASLRDGR